MAQAQFSDGGVEHIARIIGEAFVGGTIDRMLTKAGVPLTNESTKWRRIDSSLRAQQACTSCGNCVLSFIRQAVNPQQWVGQKANFEELRTALNEVLIFDGIEIHPDGQLVARKAARTHDEAAALSRRLRDGVVARGGHAQVFRYCSTELVQGDAFNAVFEAIKGLAERVRELTGLDLDGHELVAAALEGQSPAMALNTRRTETERNEQRGVANLMKGLFGAFRNPPAHEPRVNWHVSEADALDVLSTVSLIHRRLDVAVILRRAA